MNSSHDLKIMAETLDKRFAEIVYLYTQRGKETDALVRRKYRFTTRKATFPQIHNATCHTQRTRPKRFGN